MVLSGPNGFVGVVGTDCFNNVTVAQLERAQLDRVLGPVQYFSQLEDLYLAGAKITDQDLACLQEKRHLALLDISRTGVSDHGLAHLKGLSSLKMLCLDGTKVTDSGMRIVKGLNNLEAEPRRNRIHRQRVGSFEGLDQPPNTRGEEAPR